MDAKRFVMPMLYILAAAGGGFAGGVLSDHARYLAFGNWSQNLVVAANEFHLVDKAGKLKARLFSESEFESKLTLYGRNDQEEASIAANVLGGQLILSSPLTGDLKTNWRVDLSAVTSGAQLKLNHPNKFREVALEANQYGTSLSLLGRDHKTEIDIADDAWNGERPRLWLWKDETPRAGLALDKEG